MSTSTPSQHPATAATDSVASEEGMVRARPLTDADINALCRRTLDSTPDEVEVFVAERSLAHGLTLTPATLRLGAPRGRDRYATEHPYIGCVGEPIFPTIRKSELSRRRAAQQTAAPDAANERPPTSKPDSPRSRRSSRSIACSPRAGSRASSSSSSASCRQAPRRSPLSSSRPNISPGSAAVCRL